MSLRSKVMIFSLVLIAQLCLLGPVYGQRKGGRDTTAAGKAEGKGEGKLRQKNGKPLVIVVASHSSNTYWTNDITEAELENALVQSGRFTTLSRSALEAILKE